MSRLPILRWPDPRLAAVCEPIMGITDDILRLADDMLETMYAAPGRGLAAPQVGVLKRLFVMDTDWKEGDRNPQVFMNPVVLSRSATLAARDEGCLSIPGITTNISRPDRVELEWMDVAGETRRAAFDGFAAACVQHEIDHLDGIVTFDRLDAEKRAAALAEYGEVQV